MVALVAGCGKSGGGGAGAGGTAGGVAGSGGDAGEMSCTPAPRTFTFVRETIRDLAAGTPVWSMLLQPGDVPLFFYSSAALTAGHLMVTRRPERTEAGVTFGLGYRISRGQGPVAGIPVIRDRVLPRRGYGAPGAWRYDGPMPDFGTQSTGRDVTPAIAFGPAGQIHLVYGGYSVGVVYAYFDGCAWSKQVVDSDPMQGENASIAVDSAGNPHVAYGPAIDPFTDLSPAGPLSYVHASP